MRELIIKATRSKRILLGVVLILVLGSFLLLSSQNKGNPKDKRGDEPVIVSTSPVQVKDMSIELQAIGNVEASETVSIQSQVEGQLRRVHFKQGDFVKAGQLLFEIDPRLQRETVSQAKALLSRSQATIQQSRSNVAQASAQVDLAEANLQRDIAQMELAQAQESRYRGLLEQKFVTREQYEQMRTALATTQAAVEAGRAALANAKAQVQTNQASVNTSIASAYADQATLDSARIQLGFTRIYAPISGKTGPLLVNAGNTVQANMTPLISIGRLEPVFVAFSIPEKDLPSVQNAMRHGPVTTLAVVNGESQQTLTGRLFFIDNNVDPSSGTVRLKAEFSNQGQLLWPGRYTDVILRLGKQTNVMVIPASAIQQGQDGDFVYVVENKRALVKPVVVERIVQGQAVIHRGLRPEDIVVIDGQLRLAPDMPVKTENASR